MHPFVGKVGVEDIKLPVGELGIDDGVIQADQVAFDRLIDGKDDVIADLDPVIFIDKTELADVQHTQMPPGLRQGEDVFEETLFLAVKEVDQDHIERMDQIGGFVAELLEDRIGLVIVVFRHVVDDTVGEAVDEHVGLADLVVFTRIPENNLGLGMVEPLLENAVFMIDRRLGKGTVRSQVFDKIKHPPDMDPVLQVTAQFGTVAGLGVDKLAFKVAFGHAVARQVKMVVDRLVIHIQRAVFKQDPEDPFSDKLDPGNNVGERNIQLPVEFPHPGIAGFDILPGGMQRSDQKLLLFFDQCPDLFIIPEIDGQVVVIEHVLIKLFKNRFEIRFD